MLTIDQAFNLAMQHHQTGRLAEAENLYRQILAREPCHADTLNLLGLLALQVGRADAAVELIQSAVNLGLHHPEVCSNLGNALRTVGQLDRAISMFERALAMNPNLPGVHLNLGIALKSKGQTDPAIAAYVRCIHLDPNIADAHFHLGTALTEQSKMDRAIGAFADAVRANPNHVDAHWNLAFLLLITGDFQRGWKEYEWRRKFDPRSQPTQPQWDGSNLDGRTILIQTEQGFGDTIQFIRFIPMLAARGGRVLIQTLGPLKELLQTQFRQCQIITEDELHPAFDVYCPLATLPLMFGTTVDTIPREIPYVTADPSRAVTWKQKLTTDSLKVGLVWAGNPDFIHDQLRSPRELSLFAPLAAAKNVQFVSLQKGAAAFQTGNPSADMQLLDWTNDLHDFADTAALIANLDLVISSDTAVAHLAGAMGKPTWVILPAAPDWRWLLHREDCPWYPTMRLFRQTRAGDWREVMQRVCDALVHFATEPRTQ